MDIDLFYKAPKQLFSSNGFVSKKTGEILPLTQNAKILLMYMIDRTSFFGSSGLKLFETQRTIGEACGIEYKAVARTLKVFVDHEIIVAEKKRNLDISPHAQWYYTSVDTSVELIGRIEVIKPEPRPKVSCDYTDDFLDSL